ncbi:protein O-linked-mannose beta-1,2-N-acetylglucosaminyltransferase 1-like [Oscarella lobularis]|uniref:protein O-linked-mannose beta-1,2-N-acetylglucosaminyltransferase 1-like n=1 Tax=Oscarella lobularis TaxID=121494 RepID=UPI003313FBCE
MTFLSVFRTKKGSLCFRLLLIATIAIVIYYNYTRLTGVTSLEAGPPSARRSIVSSPTKKTQAPAQNRLPLCGQKTACESSHLAIHVVSGPDTDSAFICVEGKDIVTSVNSRRGINVVVIHGRTKSVVAVKNFDTYSEEGDEFSEFLNGINDGRIVVMATADDASYRLGKVGRAAIRKFGSSKIDSLNFRGSWLMIGQKGMKGTSIYEEIDPAELGLWSNGVEFSGCVPIQVDSLNFGISAHQSFCAQHEGYGPFCSVSQASQPITHSPQSSTRFHHTIPIVIIASSNRGSYLAQCIQSLFALPGLNSSLISVFIDGYSVEIQRLVNLFLIKNVQFPKVKSTSDMEQIFRNADVVAAHYFRSLKTSWEIFPTKDCVIVLEEDLIVSPDFLYYFHYLKPLLDKDETLLTVSAWNDNGYLHTSTDNSKLYRTEFFPGLGWLLSKSLWLEISPKWPPCCYGWSWDLWLREAAQTKERDSIFPDVSRVYHIGRNGLNVNGYYFDQYFKNRAMNKDQTPVFVDINQLLLPNYEAELEKILSSGTLLPHGQDSNPCSKDYVPDSQGGIFLLLYYQSSSDDVQVLTKLCTCFRIWDLGVRGLFRGVLGFHLKKNQIFAVGSQSKFAKLPVFTKTQPLTRV